MSSFWKLVAMGATAVAAVVVAKEVIERNERGEDCSPMAVIKGIGKKIGDFCTVNDEAADEDFDDFEDFELDDDDSEDFDTTDMESDKLTDDGYIVEFNAEDESVGEPPVEMPGDEASAGEAAPAEDASVSAFDEEDADEGDISTDE